MSRPCHMLSQGGRVTCYPRTRVPNGAEGKAKQRKEKKRQRKQGDYPGSPCQRYPGPPVSHVIPGRACHMLSWDACQMVPKAKQSKGKKRRGKQSKVLTPRSPCQRYPGPPVSHVIPGPVCHMLTQTAWYSTSKNDESCCVYETLRPYT